MRLRDFIPAVSCVALLFAPANHNSMKSLVASLSARSNLQSGTTSSEQDIRHLVDRYMEVRNHMDQAALRELLTPDADQLVSTGVWRRGLEDLVQGAMASSRKENGRSSVVLQSVRVLGSDTAIADGLYQTSTSASQTRKMWSTFVLQRSSGAWRIAAIRNMLPAPSVP